MRRKIEEEMTLQELIQKATEYQLYIIIYFAVIITLSFVFAKFHKSLPVITFYDYVLSTLIYLVSIPGIISLWLLFYSMFFQRRNLLQLDLIFYFLPVLSMGLVFFMIKKVTSFNRLPGFQKLSGLMTILLIINLFLFFLYNLRFHIAFFGSIDTLFYIGIALFVAFKLAVRKLGN